MNPELRQEERTNLVGSAEGEAARSSSDRPVQLVRAAESKSTTRVLGGLNRLKAGTSDTSGAWSLFVSSFPAGEGVPPHIHHQEDEAYYFLSSNWEVTDHDTGEVELAGPEDYVYVPRGRLHSFKCLGPGTGRLVLLIAPGGLEGFFEGIGQVIEDPDNPPAPPSGPPDFAKAAEVAARHHISFVIPQQREGTPNSSVTDSAEPGAQQNKQLMVRMIEEVWNRGNLAAADEIFAADHFSPSAPDLPRGPESVKLLAGMFRDAMPDFHMDIDLLMANDSQVVARFTQSGTHTGAPLMGMAASGRRATWTEIGVLRVADGKVAESWYEVDMLAMLNQLNPRNGSGDREQSANRDGPTTVPTRREDPAILARNKWTVSRFLDLLASDNLTGLQELLAPDFINHEGSSATGLAGLTNSFEALRKAVPDLAFHADYLVAEADRVAARSTISGTHAGSLSGETPTRSRLAWSELSIFRLDQSGRIVERWRDADTMSLLTQLGAVPGLSAS